MNRSKTTERLLAANCRLACGLVSVGARPFFIKRAQRDPQNRAQFFTSDANNNSSNYFSISTVTSNILGVEKGRTIPGILRRKAYTGPGWWNMDFSVLKDTHLTAALNMQFRAEFFNIFNHPTFGTPGASIGSSNFGLSTATQSSERELQFGLRLML